MKLSTILARARKRIEKPWQWIQHYYAQNMRRDIVQANDPKACRFCAVGAVLAVLGLSDVSDKPNSISKRAIRLLDEESPSLNLCSTGVIGYNDYLATHDGVIAVFDRAIKKAKENERRKK